MNVSIVVLTPVVMRAAHTFHWSRSQYSISLEQLEQLPLPLKASVIAIRLMALTP